MKYAVDRIIDNIAILENIETGSNLKIDTKLLPSPLHEGAILIYQDGIYILDETTEEKRRNQIEERFKRLKSN